MSTATPTRGRAAGIRVALLDDHRLVLDGLVARLSARATGMTVAAAESSCAGFAHAVSVVFDGAGSVGGGFAPPAERAAAVSAGGWGAGEDGAAAAFP